MVALEPVRRRIKGLREPMEKINLMRTPLLLLRASIVVLESSLEVLLSLLVAVAAVTEVVRGDEDCSLGKDVAEREEGSEPRLMKALLGAELRRLVT